MTPLVKMLIEQEMVRARKKFPEPTYLVTALTEEVGEAAKEILHYGVESKTTILYYVRAELVQVASTAIRLIEEGDITHNLPPSRLG